MDGEQMMGSAAIDEVESALAAFPGVAEIAVTEHDNGTADHYLIAYVTPKGPGLDMAELRAHARKTLPAGTTPAAIVLVDQITLTAAGTVDTAALPAPELDGLLPYRAPATPRQELVCNLFAEVLGVARCGMDNDFFDLGGRSVEAMVLAGRLSTALGVRMSMADLFKAPTAGDIDRRLDLIADARK
jgi:nonribosomal peptide synthetase DhbF